jgi:mannose-6-phosphate isomerase-like protein (cupin superfamily)
MLPAAVAQPGRSHGGARMQAQSEPPISDVDIVALARSSDDFRREVMTGPNMQIVVMTIPPGEEIGDEVHPDTDQVLFFVDGQGAAVLDGQETAIAAGHLVFVHAGQRHNFVNTGSTPLRLVTAYAPPEHPAGTVHTTKAEADAAEHHH